jgi:hypothetical protein
MKHAAKTGRGLRPAGAIAVVTTAVALAAPAPEAAAYNTLDGSFRS